MKPPENPSSLTNNNENLPPYSQRGQFEKRLIDRRQIWAANRFWMEIDNLKDEAVWKQGASPLVHLTFNDEIFPVFPSDDPVLSEGFEMPKKIVLREMPLYFSNLPESFEGFTILHLSDLHLDGMDGIEDKVLEVLENRVVDLCVLTGDYRTKLHGLNRHIIKGLQYLIGNIKSHHGFMGVLGNHDDCHMVNPMEQIGINMLINGAYFIYRGDQRIQIIGTDDVHYYYTDQALHALEHAEANFSIALVHSPELYDLAAEMGVDLYLCGHTHAGQVCLPGGRAIIKHLNRGHQFYKGSWQYKEMQGVTHSGVGTSGIPVRFNTQGEVLIYSLHQSL